VLAENKLVFVVASVLFVSFCSIASSAETNDSLRSGKPDEDRIRLTALPEPFSFVLVVVLLELLLPRCQRRG
jgi:hypothetical protein